MNKMRTILHLVKLYAIFFILYFKQGELNIFLMRCKDKNFLKLCYNFYLSNWERVGELSTSFSCYMEDYVIIRSLILSYFHQGKYNDVIYLSEFVLKKYKPGDFDLGDSYLLALTKVGKYEDVVRKREEIKLKTKVSYICLIQAQYNLFGSDKIECLLTELSIKFGDENYSLLVKNGFYDLVLYVLNSQNDLQKKDKDFEIANIYFLMQDFDKALELYNLYPNHLNDKIIFRTLFCYYKLGMYFEGAKFIKNQVSHASQLSLQDAEEIYYSVESPNSTELISAGCCYFDNGYFEFSIKSFLIAYMPTKSDYKLLYELESLNDDVILYCSYNGTSFSGNPYALFKLKYYTNPNMKHIIVLNDFLKIPEMLSDLENVHFVRTNSFEHKRFLSIAKVIILDSTLPLYFVPKIEQVILNTWHGTPIKKLGYDIPNYGFLSSKNVARSLNIATHLIHPNQYTKNILNKSYSIELCDTNNVVTGYPRIDTMLNSIDKEQLNLKRRLGLSIDKKIVLYAPTYRGDNNKDNGIELNGISLLQSKLSKIDCEFLFKGHYFTNGDSSLIDLIDTNELLSIVDVLITDYSSVAIDFMPANKPIIIYNFDHDHYETTRGLYFDFSAITDNVFNEAGDVVNCVLGYLSDENKISESSRVDKEFFNIECGLSSRTVLNFIETTKICNHNEGHNILVYITGLFEGQDRITKYLSSLVVMEVTLIIHERDLHYSDAGTFLFNLYNQGYKIIIDFDYINLEREMKYNHIFGFRKFEEIRILDFSGLVTIDNFIYNSGCKNIIYEEVKC